MNLELLSTSSQRGQLLSIIDDLNVKLKKARSLIPDSELLQRTLEAHSILKSEFKEQETKLFDQNKVVR
jgi:hypothetical protein